MTNEDSPLFVRAMGMLNLAYPRQQISPQSQALYFERLRRFSIQAVTRAIEHAVDHGGEFPPSIARLIELIEGTPEDRAALAWGRVHNAALRGYGTYRPLDFGDEVIHATVAAMGGWGVLSELSHRDAEGVDAAVKRKEFVHLYVIYANRGVPATTPKALCADPDRVGKLAAATLDEFGEYPKPPLALPPPVQDRVEILDKPPAECLDIIRKLAVEKTLPPVVEPVAKEYTQAEIDEQERRKAEKIAEARRWLNGHGQT